MFSGDGEVVPFCETLYPTGNVEEWLLEVERVMRASLKQIIKDSLKDYQEVSYMFTLIIVDWIKDNTCSIPMLNLKS